MLLDGTRYLPLPTRPAAFDGALSVVIQAANIWAPGDSTDDMPNEAHFKANAIADDRVCLDIENWDEETMLERFPTLVQWAREARPDVDVGFYGILPYRGWYETLNYYTARTNSTYAADNAAWRATTDLWLAAEVGVDTAYPSLYTMANPSSIATWKHFARLNVIEARRTGARVAGFLWPLYHFTSPATGEYVGDALWREQVRYAASICDDVVIWDDDSFGFSAGDHQNFLDVAAEGYELADAVRCCWSSPGAKDYSP